MVIALPLVTLAVAGPVAWRGRRLSSECLLFLRLAGLYLLLSAQFIVLTAQRAAVAMYPWLGGVDPVRVYTLPASFLIAVMGALGLLVLVPSAMMDSRWRRAPILVVGVMIAFLLAWPKVSLFTPLMIDSWGEHNYQVRALDELRRSDPTLFRVASVLDLQPAYAYAQGLEAADGWANLYPGIYRDLWLEVLAPLFRALPRTRNIFDPPGGRPQDHYIFLGAGLLVPGIGRLPGEDLDRALRDGFDLERRFNLHILALLNVKYLLAEYPLQGGALRLVHAPASPPIALVSRDDATGLVNGSRPSGDHVGPWERLRGLFIETRQALLRKRHGKDLYIYEHLDAMPRFRLVSQVRAAPERHGRPS